MIRLLVFLIFLALIAGGFAWVADQPGDISITFRGVHYQPDPVVAFAGVVLMGVTIAIVFWLLKLFLTAPGRVARASRKRKRDRGLAALSKGMVAAGAGDLRSAQRASALAAKGLGDEPLALLLRAQTAQLAGDRDATRETFARLAENPDTRALGLRGLHVEARRAGDSEAAHHYAREAHKLAPVAWAGTAVLEHHSSNQDWAEALKTVEANAAQRLIDRAAANRQRAVLKTAIALDLGDRDQQQALSLAREAADLAPDLTPAVALAARLLARRGDLRKAAKLIENAWKAGPHPDLARVYVDLRPGDSASDRLARAKTLARFSYGDPESAICVARAAIDAREFAIARQSMAPLTDASATARPTARMCLVMADIEEAERGQTGLAREWLSRASRAPRDKAWVADGMISDTWAPVSPTTGKLDAFRWMTPPERLTADAPWEPPTEPETVIPAPTLIEAPVVLPASEITPVVIVAPEPPAEDATKKLAAIRETARATPVSREHELAPMATAPDDPGPKKRVE
jgi:HemY protein